MTLLCSKGLPFWLVDVVDEGCKNDQDLMSERWRRLVEKEVWREGEGVAFAGGTPNDDAKKYSMSYRQ